MSHRHYFLVSQKDVFQGDSDNSPKFIQIRNEEHRHLSRALRLKIGDEVWATDGEGAMYHAVLKSIDREKSEAEILQSFRNYGEESLRLTLALGVPKMQRFEWVLEKGTELGVSQFIPMLTEHSVKFPKAQKMERWRRIVLAAVKQSGRSVIPQIHAPAGFEEVIQLSENFAHRWMAHDEPKSKNSFLGSAKSGDRQDGLVIVGPEGGFSENEIASAKNADFELINLGNRRLRAETAALAAVVTILGMPRK